MKTSELTGAALDWAVYLCHWGGDVEKYGDDYLKYKGRIGDGDSIWSPSTNWAQGGPILEREKIKLEPNLSDDALWNAAYRDQWPDNCFKGQINGPTPLIAAMCCYVASKLGDEVEIPEELL